MTDKRERSDERKQERKGKSLLRPTTVSGEIRRPVSRVYTAMLTSGVLGVVASFYG